MGFASHLATVLRQGEAVSTALRAEVRDLQLQNSELQEHFERKAQGDHCCFAPGNAAHAAWEDWWQGLIRPLQQLCEEQQRARAQAESEAFRWREEVASLEQDAALRTVAVTAAENQASAAHAVAAQLCERIASEGGLAG